MIKKIIFVLLFILFSFGYNYVLASTQEMHNYSPSVIYSKNVSSVVYIQTQDSSGSGVILKDDGTFVTCFHVIANADYIIVKLEDGSMYYVNGFRYINPLSDVAILTLDTKRKFVPISINSTNDLKVGEKVYAISNPQGLQFVFSDGMINQYTKDYIQFSAPISSGSSGGALLNLNGNLIGIITSQFNPSESQNINFALPNDYYVFQINNKQIKNLNNSKWTDFLVENADENQFTVYTNYALNQNNLLMFYKYLKPFLVRYDIPDDLYPNLAVFALYSFLYDGSDENLNDAIKFFEIAYKRNQKEEAALVGLAFLPFMKNADDQAYNYITLLSKKYPESYDKLLSISENIAKCDQNDSACSINAVLEYVDYIIQLLEK